MRAVYLIVLVLAVVVVVVDVLGREDGAVRSSLAPMRHLDGHNGDDGDKYRLLQK